MKVFYKKEYHTNKVKEIIFYHEKLEEPNMIKVTILKSATDEISTPKEILTKEYTKLEYIKLFKILKTKLENNGWKESYEEIINSKYSTYFDGKVIQGKINKFIDPFEEVEELINLTLPMIVFAKPIGYQDVYFDGQFRNDKVIPTKLLLSKATYVYKALGVPFHGFVYGDDLIVYDVAIPNYPYSVRLNILTELEGTIKTINYDKQVFKELLFKKYLELSEDSSEIYMIHSENIYIPGTSLQNAYIVAAGNFNEALVLNVEEGQALCVDYEFDSLFELKVESTLSAMSNINYRENETATVSI